MLLTLSRRLVLPLLLASSLGAGPVAAQVPAEDARLNVTPAEESASSSDAGHGSVEFRLGYYQHEDGSGNGNLFLDEDLTVVEPVIVFDYNVTDRFGLAVNLSYDLISSASIDRLSNYPNQSGASGDNYVGGGLGLRYKLSDTLRLGASASLSSEYDYTSFGFGAYVARDIDEKNTTLKFDFGGFHDVVDIIRFDGDDVEGTDTRDTLTGAATWYQVINATTHGELGGTLGYQWGFLETPYNFVVIEDSAGPPLSTGAPDYLDRDANGTIVTEELPDSRVRGALFGRLRHSFESTGTALELGGRLYADSWSIFSLTVEPRVYQWLVDKILAVRLRYRFYVQSAADDYERHFRTDTPGDRTQDSDLGEFDAHGVGLRFDWYVTSELRTDIGVDYVMRSDGIDEIFSSAGLRWEF